MKTAVLAIIALWREGVWRKTITNEIHVLEN